MVFLEATRQILLIFMTDTFLCLPKVPRMLVTSEKATMCVSVEGSCAHTRTPWEWLKSRSHPEVLIQPAGPASLCASQPAPGEVGVLGGSGNNSESTRKLQASDSSCAANCRVTSESHLMPLKLQFPHLKNRRENNRASQVD